MLYKTKITILKGLWPYVKKEYMLTVWKVKKYKQSENVVKQVHPERQSWFHCFNLIDNDTTNLEISLNLSQTIDNVYYLVGPLIFE